MSAGIYSELLSGFLGALALWLLQEWRKAKAAPRLKLRARRGRPFVVDRLRRNASFVPSAMQNGFHDTRWLRVTVENEGGTAARQCRVFVKEFYEQRGRENLLDNPVQLKWAGSLGFEFDLPPGLPTAVDVLVAFEGQRSLALPEHRAPDDQLVRLLNSEGPGRAKHFRLILLAVAEGCEPQTNEVRFHWAGDRETLQWA
jgi:hypothetical protein